MKHNKDQYSSVRVLKKNTIFINGFPILLNDRQIRHELLFGRFGEIDKINCRRNFRSLSLYLTYSSPQAAALALLVLSHLPTSIKVLFGTMQYCKYFLKKIECKNSHCNYLHIRDKKNQIIIDDQIGAEVYEEHYAIALQVLKDNFNEIQSQIAPKRIFFDENSELYDLAQSFQSSIQQIKGLIGEIPPPKQNTESPPPPIQAQKKVQQKVQQIVEPKKSIASDQIYLKIKIIRKMLRSQQSKISLERQSIADAANLQYIQRML